MREPVDSNVRVVLTVVSVLVSVFVVFVTLPSDRIKAGDFLARVGGQIEPPTVKLELSLSEKRARIREMLLDDSDED